MKFLSALLKDLFLSKEAKNRSTPSARTLVCERLEDRCLLSVSSYSYSLNEHTGLYSANFIFDSGTTGAYITGLTLDDLNNLASKYTGTNNDSFSGHFIDADKANERKDSNLCWAASACNLLINAGWANSTLTPKLDNASFNNEDQVLEYFTSYWDNIAGGISNGVNWFINGKEFATNHELVPGGGYYPDIINTDNYYNYTNITDYTVFSNSILKLKTNDCAVGLSVGWFANGPGTKLDTINDRNGGHAITLYGYLYDSQYDPTNPSYYTGLIIADSDDDKFQGASADNTIDTYHITWDPINSLYCMETYRSGNDYAWVDGSTWLTVNTNYKRLPALATPQITVSSLDFESASLTITGVENANEYTVEYSTDENFTSFFTQNYASAGSHTLNGLSENTTYYFRSKALASTSTVWSDSYYSAKVSTKTPYHAVPLTTPTNFMVQSTELHTATVSFDLVDNASSYLLEFSTSSDFTKAFYYQFTADSGSFTVAGLSANTEYFFRMKGIGNVIRYLDSEWTSTLKTKTLEGTETDPTSKLIITTLSDIEANDGLISLREAINSINTGNINTNTITFHSSLKGGAIVLNNMITIMGSFILEANDLYDSEMNRSGITIDGYNSCRLFEINTYSNVPQVAKFNGITFKNGTTTDSAGGGAILFWNGALTIDNCCFYNNSTSIKGGAIYGNNILSITNSQFINNKSQSYGGAIAAHGKTNISSCVFTSNSAEKVAGAIYHYSTDTIEITDTVFESNHSKGMGGAIYTDSICTIVRSIFAKNSSEEWGGAITFAGSDKSVISNSLFYENSCAVLGGAILSWSDLNLINCTLANNSGQEGSGAVHAYGSNITFYNSIVVFNSGKEIGKQDDGSSIPSLSAHNLLISTDLQDIEWNDESTNITVCPQGTSLFENAAAGDYHLIRGSKWTSNSGSNSWLELAGNQDKDLGGNTRILDEIVDLGAYEALLYAYEIPTLLVKQYTFANNQVLKLVLHSSSNNPYPIEEWIISWGDNETPEDFLLQTNQIKSAHYYAESGSYHLELTIKSGYYSTTYYLGSHTVEKRGESEVPVDNSASQTVITAASALPDNKEISDFDTPNQYENGPFLSQNNTAREESVENQESIQIKPVLLYEIQADQFLYLPNQNSYAERWAIFRSGNWDESDDSDEFRTSLFQLLLKSGDNTAVHLTDAAFAEIQGHSDLFHSHFFVIIENNNKSLVASKSFGYQTHEIGLLDPARGIFPALIFDQIDFRDIF